MDKIIVVFILLVSVPFLFGQSIAEKYQFYIDTSDIKSHITILASDSLEGRKTGSQGQDKAAAYINRHFKKLQLNSFDTLNYYQDFTVVKINPSATLRINNQEKELFTDFVLSYDHSISSASNLEGLIILSDIDDINLNKLDVKNKVVFYIDTITNDPEKKVQLWKNNYVFFSEKEAAGLVFITNDFEQISDTYSYAFSSSKHVLESEVKPLNEMFLLFANSGLLQNEWSDLPKNKWFQKKKYTHSISNVSFSKNTDTTHLKGRNVIGLMKGKNDAKETLLIIAHYDHLGIIDGEIYNGADDNATGIAALIELAEAFYVAKNQEGALEKNILFVAVSAEEIGLLGSKYFSQHPLIPLENIISVLNIDMIGRTDENYDHPDYIYVIGSDMISDKLHQQNEEANQFIKLTLDYTYNSEDHPLRLYYRSDHVHFAKQGIPSIFYFGGFHEDYHQPTDTANKIDFSKVENITRFIFFTAWNIVNGL